MDVGVKYCGGCNPAYERSAVVKRAQAEFPDIRFTPYAPDLPFDLVVVVCGCTQECFSFSCSNSKHGTVWVRSAQEYARLQRALCALEERHSLDPSPPETER